MNLFLAPVPIAAVVLLVVGIALLWRRTPSLRGFLRGGRFRRTYDDLCTPMDAVTFRQPGEVPVYQEPDGRLLGFLASKISGDFMSAEGVLLSRKRGSWVTRSTKNDLLAALRPGTFRAVALLLLALLLPAVAHAIDYPAAALSQAYHPAIRAGALVCAFGFVESTRKERDGDLHVWLCASATKRTMPERRQGCVLGEIVPSRPLPRPPRGVLIRMCGGWVESDLPHGWTEMHPVSEWTVAK